MVTPVPATPAPATPFVPTGAYDKSFAGPCKTDEVHQPFLAQALEYSPGSPLEETSVKLEITWPEGELGTGVIDLEEPEILTRPWSSDSDDETSSSGSESSDGDASGKVEASHAAEHETVPSSVKWFINAKTLVIHHKRDSKSFRCGRMLGDTYFPVPELNGLRCSKCFASSL